MFAIIPIKTESVSPKHPTVNYFIIGINILAFLIFHNPFKSSSSLSVSDTAQGLAALEESLVFLSDAPEMYQFFTYQFLHADGWHLLGNMLFLWVFGNGVNGKLGNIAYAMFYLAGGAFAAWGYALVNSESFILIGASGAIASVTTAYLAMFPRSRVTVLIWFFIFIHFIQVPAMILILVKIVLWDNLISPSMGGAGNTAHAAHIAGYLFGFVAAMFLLIFRAIPRDQYDMLALWKRWNQRRSFSSTMSDPNAAAQAQYGTVARPVVLNSAEQATQEKRLDEISDFRTKISDAIIRGDIDSGVQLFEQLIAKDPQQCLSEKNQMAIAREFYRTGRFPQAAAAFERFVEYYPRSNDTTDIKLLLGIIYARDLHQFEVADKHLTESMNSLRDEKRRNQCFEWLTRVREALGKSAPEM